jgi:hypothetical protein
MGHKHEDGGRGYYFPEWNNFDNHLEEEALPEPRNDELLNPPTHLYKKDGTYKITLTVSDDHAGQTIIEKSITFP